MGELRKDPIFNRSVIVAENRADRPHAFLPREPIAAVSAADCPFCPGNEHETPHEIFALRDAESGDDAPDWRLRVIPNKFPAVTAGEQAQGAGAPAMGVHEVVIDSARHVASFSELTDSEAEAVFAAYQRRIADFAADGRWRFGIAFKNVGDAAGASIEHVHSQLIAMGEPPPGVAEDWDACRAARARSGECPLCALIKNEAAAGTRVVEETADFLAFCPFASRMPFETWILGKAHPRHFAYIHGEETARLAHVCRRTLRRIEAVLARPAYNWVLHVGPLEKTADTEYHWRLELIPRVASWAGFEWGTGCYINPVAPERAAAMLRTAQV